MVVRPTAVLDAGLICELLWADPEEDIQGWCEIVRGASSILGPGIVQNFPRKHDPDLVGRGRQVDGCEVFTKRQLIVIFEEAEAEAMASAAGAFATLRLPQEELLGLGRRRQRHTVRGAPFHYSPGPRALRAVLKRHEDEDFFEA